MFNIAICDDDKVICTILEDIILNYRNSYQKNLDTQVYYTGEELLGAIERGNNIDLLFLDIELISQNGIDLGEKIRNYYNNQTMQIVYISGSDRYAMKLFDIHPLNFLIKPLKKEKVIDCIELGISLLNKLNGFFSYKSGFDSKKIPLKDIFYFESSNRKIKIITKNGTDTFYGKLEPIFEELKEQQFLYIHKSYLVNYFYVEYFHYEFLILDGGITLPISQSRRKAIRELSLRLMNKESKS